MRALSVVLLLVLPGGAWAAHAFFDSLREPPERYRVALEKSAMVPMRDGISLSTDIYRPEGLEGPLPVILVRTPYDKRPFREYTEARARGREVRLRSDDPFVFASRGYIVLVQDHRGRFESEGEFFPYNRVDGQDGYDTVSWIVAQRWASGKVGTIGCSFHGETQHMLATQRHPNHTTAIAMSGSSSSAPGGVYNFGFMRYGMLKLAGSIGWNELTVRRFGYGPPAGVDRQAWFQSPESQWYAPGPLPTKTSQERLAALSTLPVRDVMTALYGSKVPSAFEEWLEQGSNPAGEYWWKRQGIVTDVDRFDVPALHINSWYDGTPQSTLDLFRLFSQNAVSARAQDNQFLIMAPSTHCQFDRMTRESVVGDRPLGDDLSRLVRVLAARSG
jgi:predicted acyl esterase